MQSVLRHYCISSSRIAKVRLPQYASFGAFATEVAMYVHLLPSPCLSGRMSIWRTARRICLWDLILQGFTKICRYVAICITTGDSSLSAVARTPFARSCHNFGMHLTNTTVLLQMKLHISSLKAKTLATEEINRNKRMHIRHINQTKKGIESKLLYSDWKIPQLYLWRQKINLGTPWLWLYVLRNWQRFDKKKMAIPKLTVSLLSLLPSRNLKPFPQELRGRSMQLTTQLHRRQIIW
jgi:hypothetical protein